MMVDFGSLNGFGLGSTLVGFEFGAMRRQAENEETLTGEEWDAMIPSICS